MCVARRLFLALNRFSLDRHPLFPHQVCLSWESRSWVSLFSHHHHESLLRTCEYTGRGALMKKNRSPQALGTLLVPFIKGYPHHPTCFGAWTGWVITDVDPPAAISKSCRCRCSEQRRRHLENTTRWHLQRHITIHRLRSPSHPPHTATSHLFEITRYPSRHSGTVAPTGSRLFAFSG